ncbi:MAG: DUF1553 domain-containing protein [Planctomycetaceae bacterium]
MSSARLSVLALLIFVITCPAGAVCRADDIFRQNIAPILERRCLSCHDRTSHKGDFSLQTRADLMDSGFVQPGQPDESHLLDVITPRDGRAQMPKDADALTADEQQNIRRWIADGAAWPDDVELHESTVTSFDWWSWQPLLRPQVPELNEADRHLALTDIDRFILRNLRQRGLSLSAEADRRTLIRRVTQDLIGLPPTPEDVDAFVSNTSPDAYSQLVDRLLDSPQYGERWARHWLDVVRYADTCGYDKDKLRPNAWPYRDYVIRSFNDDKPYARFVQEQIAGDVLFPGEPDGILGLGFLAAGPWDFIGHVEVPESKLDGLVARNLDRDDMVCNTLNTFCSVTIQCARCHNHKFDPMTQQHYYGLQAVFAAVDRAERVYDQDPEIIQQRQHIERQLTDFRKQLRHLEQEIKTQGGAVLEELQQRTAQLSSENTVQKSAEFGYHSAIADRADVAKQVTIDLGSEHSIARIVINACHDEYAGIGAGFGFPRRYRIDVSLDQAQWQTVLDNTSADVPNPGLVPVGIELPSPHAARYIRFAATRLAERSHDYILALAEIQVFGSTDSNTNIAISAQVTSPDSIEAPVRWRRSNLTDGQWPVASDPEVSRQLADAISQRDQLLKQIETPERIQRRTDLQKSIAGAEVQLKQLPAGRRVYAAATDFPAQGNFRPTQGKPRKIHVLHRGDIQQPTVPAVPGVLPLTESADWQLDEALNEGQRRAALAEWLTSPQHPLVWRSIVNRVWLYHFGEGLVATPNDFGRMGSRPTHPELLDRLALEFQESGQSFKALHRLIVNSAVYRQSSDDRSDAAEADGSNQFLWRMNRRRLEAEEIRDAILSVSGALDPKMGGPGYYLFKLERPEHSPHYEYHLFDPADPDSHRRSIYRFVVRSQPDPWMTTLDCADSSQSTPRRTETLTSLQALSLLNSRFNLVMAQKMADDLTSRHSAIPGQVREAFRRVTLRSPAPEETEQLIAYAAEHGLRALCRLLFNLSEFVYVD